MPKEKLNYDRTEKRFTQEQVDSELTQVGYDEQQPLVTLHWNPDNYAQFSVVVDRAAAKKLMDEAEPQEATLTFWGMPMERREMQEAIRALKRARNQVFGADE